MPNTTLKLMAVIYATNSVLNNQVRPAYNGYNFSVILRGINIVLSSCFLSQYILVKEEKLEIHKTINFIDLHFNVT